MDSTNIHQSKAVYHPFGILPLARKLPYSSLVHLSHDDITLLQTFSSSQLNDEYSDILHASILNNSANNSNNRKAKIDNKHIDNCTLKKCHNIKENIKKVYYNNNEEKTALLPIYNKIQEKLSSINRKLVKSETKYNITTNEYTTLKTAISNLNLNISEVERNKAMLANDKNEIENKVSYIVSVRTQYVLTIVFILHGYIVCV